MLVFNFLEMIDYFVKCTFSFGMVIYVCPWVVVIAIFSTIYLVRIRRICVLITQDPIRLKFALMSPVNSLIQDAVNGLPTLRCLGQKQYFIDRLFKSTDMQTRAHVTSNGGNRWTAFRIDS